MSAWKPNGGDQKMLIGLRLVALFIGNIRDSINGLHTRVRFEINNGVVQKLDFWTKQTRPPLCRHHRPGQFTLGYA